jgi:hypothetical protein
MHAPRQPPAQVQCKRFFVLDGMLIGRALGALAQAERKAFRDSAPHPELQAKNPAATPAVN